MYADIPEELRDLIEPIVRDHALELVDVELGSGRAPRRLFVVVDTAEGDGRVPVDRCASLSREIGTHLDARDAVEGRYVLEVSSPGFDRVLAREKDFQRATGSQIKLKTRRPVGGRSSFRGTLVAFEEAVARVDVDGDEFRIPFAEIARAHSVYEFTAEDFARRA